VELLVALPVAVLVAAVAGVLLVRLARTARVHDTQLSTSRELRHAALVLEADLAAVRPADLVTASDSLIEALVPQGVLQVCAVTAPSTMDVALPADSLDGAWLSAVRAGDDARVFHAAAMVTDTPVTMVRPLVKASGLAAAPCGVGTPATPVRQWRLTFADSQASLAGAGHPLVVRRPVRYSHYRSGSNWWLGRRTRDLAGWDVVQPVAGPLHSAAKGGMRVSILTATGAATTRPDSAALLRIMLRAPHTVAQQNGRDTDSLRVLLPLRPDASVRRP
jgi:hypothetical protein